MTRKELAEKSVFLQCTKSFLDFKKGQFYWLEVINNKGGDMYCVRSDNCVGRYYRFPEKDLIANFKSRTMAIGLIHIS